MTDYVIITAQNLPKLEEEINRVVMKSYIPTGGPIFDRIHNVWGQAFYRVKKP